MDQNNVIILFIFIIVLVGGGVCALVEHWNSKPVKQIKTKAQTEEEARRAWVEAFNGEPTEGRHRIVRTDYVLALKRDYWPRWTCACGHSEKEVAWNYEPLEVAEKRALKDAKDHVERLNYAEWKAKNSENGRAF